MKGSIKAEPNDARSAFESCHRGQIVVAVKQCGHSLGKSVGFWPEVNQGDGYATWAVNRRAVARGLGIRTGLEDVRILRDRPSASCNGESIAAAAMLRQWGT